MKEQYMMVGGRHARVVIGGTQHQSATSFLPAKIRSYEKTKQYLDQGIVWVSPTRGKIYTNVVISWLSLMWPMNQKRSPLFATQGIEVAAAYDWLIRLSMSEKRLGQGFTPAYARAIAQCPFILTTEEDNVLPADSVLKLFTAIFACPDCGAEIDPKNWKCGRGHRGFDAVSGLYFIKTTPPIPMAFGTPNGSRKPDFRPRSVVSAIKGGKVLEVNGIAMGCALWRKKIFRQVKRPWFRTTPSETQDLYFCKRAKLQAHARFGVHCGLRVGHYQPDSGELY